MLKEITINGLRGFSSEKKINLAMPDGRQGSGLTILVGSNNSGKTTIIEAIKYYNFDISHISFSSGKRNNKTDKKVYITYRDEKDETYSIHSKSSYGSQVESHDKKVLEPKKVPFILPSRRSVQYELYGGFYDSYRWDYMNNENMNTKVRKPTIDNFQQRIFRWEMNRKKFDAMLYRLLDSNLKWYIDQNDNGGYYLAFEHDKHGVHTSEGVGDGIWSIFTIVDALYDAEDGATIVIDEPELSLHPQYQKKIMSLILKESANKQIIISTHSPYFISWDALENGAVINRTIKEAKTGEIDVRRLSEDNAKFICKTIRDLHNPHLWGIEAKELFFLEDSIIVVEGQEDVISFNKLLEEFNIEINANFFGWGAGGADKIDKILGILDNLGYKNVIAIYDGDKIDQFKKCRKKYKQYKVLKLWKDDIRDKEARRLQYKEGILDKHFEVKEGSKKRILRFLGKIRSYFD